MAGVIHMAAGKPLHSLCKPHGPPTAHPDRVTTWLDSITCADCRQLLRELQEGEKEK